MTDDTPMPSPVPSLGLFPADLLDRCISCGFCLPACPTYSRTQDEKSSPRGRITLMRALESGALAPDDPTLVEESSFCLGCRACEPVCPAGVEYGQLLERWRDHQWSGRSRPVMARLLTMVTARRWLIRFPGVIRRHARTPRRDGPHLMLGCAERSLFPGVSRSVLRQWPELDAPGAQGCCGALHAHNGERERGRALGKALGEELPGTIVTTSGGCAAHLADVIGRDRVVEISEYITRTTEQQLGEVRVNGRRARVTLQDSCHLRNGLGVWKEPRALLEQVADFIELPSAAGCCGAAGTYSLVRRSDSRAVLEAKVAEIQSLGVDFVVTVNPGCLRQLQQGVRRERIGTQVVHLVEFLELAAVSGGS